MSRESKLFTKIDISTHKLQVQSAKYIVSK